MSDVLQRMSAANDALFRSYSGKRYPKAFYLTPDDWSAFMATNPPTGRFPWANNPTVWRTEPKFGSAPVRESTGKRSRLYDNTGAGRTVA